MIERGHVESFQVEQMCLVGPLSLFSQSTIPVSSIYEFPCTPPHHPTLFPFKIEFPFGAFSRENILEKENYFPRENFFFPSSNNDEAP